METTATTLHKESPGFVVQQLSPALGAEIERIDLRDPISDALKEKLLDTSHEHLVSAKCFGKAHLGIFVDNLVPHSASCA